MKVVDRQVSQDRWAAFVRREADKLGRQLRAEFWRRLRQPADQYRYGRDSV